jgi:hypothetical protein
MDEIAVALSWRFTQLRKNDGVEQIHAGKSDRDNEGRGVGNRAFRSGWQCKSLRGPAWLPFTVKE